MDTRARRRARVIALLAASALMATVPTGSVQAAPPRQAAPPPLSGRVVVIDPGHQLGNSRHPREINQQVWVGLWKACNTTGTATDSGFPEATFTWRVSSALARRLQELGASVHPTRTTNSVAAWGPCIDERGEKGAAVGADLAISLHGDGAAAGTRGFFVIRPGLRVGWTDDIYRESAVLARHVRAGLLGAGFPVSSTYGGDGLDLRRDLGTLNAADVPTVMIELGNMRNAGDAACMTSATCRDRYAAGLADGVLRALTR